MSDNTGTVTFMTSEKHETFGLNGVVFDLDSGLTKFYGEEASREGLSIQLNGRRVTADANPQLRDTDVVLILPAAIASGGFKGALVSN